MSSLLLVAAGIIVAPFMVGLTNRFLGGSPAWFPYLVVMIFAGILFAVGIDMLQPFAAAVVVTTAAFGLLVQFYPQRIDFIRVNVRAPFGVILTALGLN